MSDLIDRQVAIEAVARALWHYPNDSYKYFNNYSHAEAFAKDVIGRIERLPSAQPDTSRIENILHGKSAEEQYDFLWWLMQNYGMQFTDTRIAVIEWLRGERNG